MKRTYSCHHFGRTKDPTGRPTSEAPHLSTLDVEELKRHITEVQEHDRDPRQHMLDIITTNDKGELLSLEGMCLFDAIINVDEGTVVHFLGKDEIQVESRGRKL